mmetsp:Transcript_4513/g.9278  ORF Transcript_4513/g.9278 Transcript_4513/m.9278 type:complete len:697 (+) Transcript_4513:50-2140(+)
MVQVQPSLELYEGAGYDDAVFVGTYTCPSDVDPDCPFICSTLSECDACGCFVVDEEGGPWGDAMDVIMCLLPIIFLLGVTLKPNPLPTTVSLPAAAMMMLLVRVMYLGSDPTLSCGAIISGFHEALSPLTIMFGAIALFETMEATLCLPYMMREMKSLTEGHIVAELMLIFAFAYMIEGASGFGTPVALGAPMLVSLGHDKFGSIVTLLVMNTFATVWGAAGTPIWFGLGNISGLSEDDFVEVSFKAGVCLTFAAYLILPTLVLPILCPVQELKKNFLFIILSLTSVMGPVLVMSFFTYEFPSLIGGMLGCIISAVLIRFRVGLKEYSHPTNERHLKISTTSSSHGLVSSLRPDDPLFAAVQNNCDKNSDDLKECVDNDEDVEEEHSPENGTDASISEESYNVDSKDVEVLEDADQVLASINSVEAALGPRKSFAEGYLKELIGRTFPLWGTVLLLILTRVEQIGLKGLLIKRSPYFEIAFGTYGKFRLSASLVFQLIDILTHPDLSWKYELLYVPFIIPFVLVSIITMIIYRSDLQARPKEIFGTCLVRLKKPAIALLGALALVQLMIKEGPAAPADIIGTVLSQALKEGWIAFAAIVGTLGSFFSGSTTISNLTFGGIQEIAAKSIGTSVSSMLALQATGASAGNGVCLNNIISACTVVGLDISEGKIIRKTFKPVLAIDILATVIMLAFFFRF